MVVQAIIRFEIGLCENSVFQVPDFTYGFKGGAQKNLKND